MFKALMHVKWSAFITLASIVLVTIFLGPAAGFIMIVLIAIEVAFSFDNAVVNAKILEHLSPLWQKLFLTVGILIAVFGMRLVFPILIVALAANLSWGKVIDLALNHPDEYAHYLELAHPSISAFGGAFLLTLALYFLFDKKRKEHWLPRIEKPLQKFGDYIWFAPLVALGFLGLAASLPANDHVETTLKAGALGIGVYTLMHLLITIMDKNQSKFTTGAKRTGWAAFISFMYLEILDASFSFDGVLGAFAITDNVILIAVGLGVGAIWVRTLTVQLVKHQSLGKYPYLEHGAHYAILALAFALLASISYHIPEVFTGLVGIVIILVSFWASVKATRGAKPNKPATKKHA